MTISPEDQPSWIRLYLEEYWTLEQVGDSLGITKEAVRLRLKGIGIKPRSAGETAQLRDRREISLRGDEIRMSFLQTRDVAETARRIDVSEALVRRALGELVPDFEVLTRVPRNPSKKYSMDVLMGSLREAADTVPGILTTNSYDSFVIAHPTLPDGRPRPSKQAMMLRFGFWREALLRAGLPANRHAGPEKEFDEAEAVAAVVECWRQTGGPPTAEGYDQWQRSHEGRPSMATVRKLTGNWNPLLIRAWQLVHGVVLDQDDEDVSVPEPLLPDAAPPDATPFGPYHAANEGTEVSLRSDLVVAEYNALERAVRSHAQIQNAVADAAAAVGLEPWSPSAGAPAFDIALSSDHGRVFVVEVKSATSENLELQLRIGLGQVLRYAHQLRSHAKEVVPVIAIELPPDQSWVELLTELGVGLLVDGSISSDLARLAGSQFADQPQQLNSDAAGGPEPAISRPERTLGMDSDMPEDFERAVRQLTANQLRTILDAFTPREATILAMRIGLYDGAQHTLDEISRAIGLNRQEVHEIEKKAQEVILMSTGWSDTGGLAIAPELRLDGMTFPLSKGRGGRFAARRSLAGFEPDVACGQPVVQGRCLRQLGHGGLEGGGVADGDQPGR